MLTGIHLRKRSQAPRPDPILFSYRQKGSKYRVTYLIKYYLGYLLSSFAALAVGDATAKSCHITDGKVLSPITLLTGTIT
jgi:hypothetical protein